MEQIENSPYNTDPEARRRIDELLQQNASNQAHLGNEHGKYSIERVYASKWWEAALVEIKSIDPVLWEKVND
tara:strand:- start:252 stop:467 length:216 start_codon:yes stop_codon:yes gene_type:complete